MKVVTRWEAERLLLRLRNGEKRLAYAVAYATNATALHVQRAEFAEVAGALTIRRPAFFFGTTSRPGGVAAKVKRAIPRQARLEAEVQAGRVGGRRDVILPAFERGGVRHGAGAPLLIPITGGARPTMAAQVDPKYSLARLALTTKDGARVTPRGLPEGQSARGRLGTWAARTTNAPLGAVYQRTGERVRMLRKWVAAVPIPKRLAYVRVARTTWRRRYREEFEKQALASLSRHGFRFVS